MTRCCVVHVAGEILVGIKRHKPMLLLSGDSRDAFVVGPDAIGDAVAGYLIVPSSTSGRRMLFERS